MTHEQPSQRLMVHCTKCDHEEALGWLPMTADAVAAVVRTARCPKGHARRHLALGPKLKSTTAGDPFAWLKNGDTGISSETIWAVMMGRAPHPAFRPGVPHDPADFGRCYRLLQVMPEWRARLPAVAVAHPSWAPLVTAWDELTALYEEEVGTGRAPQLYARMKALLVYGQ